jgi:hypothetical protein
MRTSILLLSATLVLGAQDPSLDSARKLVQTFYEAHTKGDMGFSEASLKAKAKFLAPDLLKTCLAKRAEDAAKGSDTVPDVDGDPFTDSQEYPDGFKVGKIRSTEGGARVPVTFTWKAGNPPRTLTVILKNLTSGWRIDDLRYPDGRTLRSVLKPSGSASKRSGE